MVASDSTLFVWWFGMYSNIPGSSQRKKLIYGEFPDHHFHLENLQIQGRDLADEEFLETTLCRTTSGSLTMLCFWNTWKVDCQVKSRVACIFLVLPLFTAI